MNLMRDAEPAPGTGFNSRFPIRERTRDLSPSWQDTAEVQRRRDRLSYLSGTGKHLKQDCNLVVSYVAERLFHNLESYGNVLTEDHRRALLRLLRDMTQAALGMSKGRRGYPLPAGAGKSQAACCWAWAAWFYGTGLSCAIASSRIESLIELRRELMAMGVPEEAIGLLHSNPEHPVPPTQDNDRRPIVLVTHARIQQGEKSLPEYAYHRGRKRDLFIWDEALISEDHLAVNFWSLSEHVNGFLGASKDTGTIPSDAEGAAYAYLGECRDLIKQEMDRQREGRKPRPLVLPQLPPGYTAAQLKAVLPEPAQVKLGGLFNHAGEQVRGLRVQNSNGAVWFTVRVPDSLDTITVLDASLAIRLLPKLTGSVVLDEPPQEFSKPLVSYENVTLFHMPEPAGRGALSETFADPKRLRGYVREFAKVIRDHIPPNEAVNIWTFLPRTLDFPKLIRKELAAAGVDCTAKVETPKGPKDRINIITWGRETATNEFAYAPHTMFAGVLYRDQLDLGAETVAANRSLISQRNLDRLQEISDSETAQAIYQAAARSAIRYQRNGKALPGTIWLPLKTPGVLEYLTKDAFPGIQVVPWRPASNDWRKRATAQDQCAAAIAAALEALPSDVDQISSKALRETMPCDFPKDVWARGTNALAAFPSENWRRQGRSWVRC